VSLVATGVADGRVALAADADYYSVAATLLRSAWDRALCSIFIVDGDPDRDRALRVDSLLYELECCAWRGADTRLLVGGSHQNLKIAQTAFTAVRLSRLHDLRARWLTRDASNRGSHIKLVVADDTILAGSHNWSGGAFSGDQIQDSVVVQSPALAARLASFFESQWSRGAGGDA
jgi:phosphatidylserine/phosphatidylglycerophosphate/cardiolipin synthase-like enzyme